MHYIMINNETTASMATSSTINNSNHIIHNMQEQREDIENFSCNTPDCRIRVRAAGATPPPPPPPPRKARGIINFMDCELLPSLNSPTSASRLLVPRLPALDHPPMMPTARPWLSPPSSNLPPMIRPRFQRRPVSVIVPPELVISKASPITPVQFPSWLMEDDDEEEEEMMDEDEEEQQQEQPEEIRKALPILDLDDLFTAVSSDGKDHQDFKGRTASASPTLLPQESLAAPLKAPGARCA